MKYHYCFEWGEDILYTTCNELTSIAISKRCKNSNTTARNSMIFRLESWIEIVSPVQWADEI